jgi:methionyl-tRNA formyltransferase
MKDPVFIEQLKQWNANLYVVVAFRMLPEVVWAMPELGTFNVHAALLPDYRGAAPINWAVINGEKQTGVTTFFLDHQIDTGRIIMQKAFDIPDDADVEYVYNGLMHLGAQICLDTLEKIISSNGHPEAIPQDNALAVHSAPKLNKDNCRVDWNSMTAKQVYNFVRGLSPVPGAWTMLKDTNANLTMLKIYKCSLTGISCQTLVPGTIQHDKKHIFIACKDELLTIENLQMAGKKRMDAAAFLNGMSDIEKYSAI